MAQSMDSCAPDQVAFVATASCHDPANGQEVRIVQLYISRQIGDWENLVNVIKHQLEMERVSFKHEILIDHGKIMGDVLSITSKENCVVLNNKFSSMYGATELVTNIHRIRATWRMENTVQKYAAGLRQHRSYVHNNLTVPGLIMQSARISKSGAKTSTRHVEEKNFTSSRRSIDKELSGIPDTVSADTGNPKATGCTRDGPVTNTGNPKGKLIADGISKDAAGCTRDGLVTSTGNPRGKSTVGGISKDCCSSLKSKDMFLKSFDMIYLVAAISLILNVITTTAYFLK